METTSGVWILQNMWGKDKGSLAQIGLDDAMRDGPGLGQPSKSNNVLLYRYGEKYSDCTAPLKYVVLKRRYDKANAQGRRGLGAFVYC
jgi:hypothetical protein